MTDKTTLAFLPLGAAASATVRSVGSYVEQAAQKLERTLNAFSRSPSRADEIVKMTQLQHDLQNILDQLKASRHEGMVLDIEVSALGNENAQAVKQFANDLPDILLSAQQEHYVHRARSLMEAYPLPDPLADEHLDNFREELKARQRYLQSVPSLTSQEVAQAARHANKNSGQTAYRWKNEQKIFSVPAAGNREVYPAFQFADGKPRAIIAELLKRLQPHRTAWEIAQWFGAPNGWLDGDRPIDLLDDAAAAELLIGAAEHEVEPNVG